MSHHQQQHRNIHNRSAACSASQARLHWGSGIIKASPRRSLGEHDTYARRVSAGATRGRSRNGTAFPAGVDGSEEDKKTKMEKLKEAVALINKTYGHGTCSYGGEGGPANIETFSTGILPLDIVLGGGWPEGKVVEIFGLESTGKTTIALYAVKEVQRRGEVAAFIDAEHALNREYAERLGIDFDKLIFAQPNSGENAFQIAEVLMNSGGVRLIVVDSVSALTPLAEVEGVLGEGSLGQLARLMSEGLRKVQGPASKKRTTLMFLNQIRNTIGGYGNPETTSGGKALKFASFVRCEVRAADRKKDAAGDVSYRCRVRLAKSKMGRAGAVAEFEMRIGEGVPHESALLDVAEKMNLVTKRGAWYTQLGPATNIQGAEKAVEYLKAHPEVMKDLELQVRALMEEEKSSLRAVAGVGGEEGAEDDDEGYGSVEE